MSDTAGEPSNTRSKRRSRRALWLCIGALLLLGPGVLPRLLMPSLPSYRGKSAKHWFRQAAEPGFQGYYESDWGKAFDEMGADAVPYLLAWGNVRPTSFDRTYARLHVHLPSRLRNDLPQPRTREYYQWRQVRALELLEGIATSEQGKAGNASGIASLAVPSLRTTLHDPNGRVRAFAARAVFPLGSDAAEVIPDLIRLTQDTDESAACAALMALGFVGPVATSVVPVLTSNAAHASGKKRLIAVQSLGQIGPPARSAAPVLVPLLSTNDLAISAASGGGGALRVMAARALAETASTLEDAVPVLLTMTQGTNPWARWFASIALWNRDRQNPALQAPVIEGLRSTNRVGVLISLGRLGTNAAPFLPEIRRLLDDPLSGYTARRILRQIDPASP